ncbi:NADH-cytochrome b5 reductase [Tulasnella sp. JGI-2019a]|nr:NADH-cytochrome b5 reductase [Tulasnella sp. JGI-2019a]
MPNSQQLVLVASSAVSFLTTALFVNHLFPGILFPSDPKYILELLGLAPTPQPTTLEQVQTTVMDTIKELFTYNGPSDLLKADKMVLIAFTGLVAVVVVGWMGGKKRKPVLDPKEYADYPLVEKVVISPNTALYRFGLPRPDDILGVPIGQHITVAAEINGKIVARSYTPTSSDDDKGHFDLVIKTYEQGNISKFVGNLKIGQTIKVRGPKGQFRYSPNMAPHINMLAGGTGITPMYQIITHILYSSASTDATKIHLIYANQAKEDILLKLELDELAARHRGRFDVHYVLERPGEGWTGGVGYVSKDMIKERMAGYTPGVKTLMCGPPPMINAMKKNLVDLGFPPAQTISKADDAVFAF